MAVLLLRLAGPMQSWGTQSRFTNRDTGLEPSKSGVIGLLCAALGIKRDDLTQIKELADLKMGVRVDRQGIMKRDFHTAMEVVIASGRDTKPCELSDRFYLADAVFLVALQGNADLLTKIQEALQKPVWQIFLGRKSFVPGLPVWLSDGLKTDTDDLEKALLNYPYLCSSAKRELASEELRLELETGYRQGDKVKQDQPESFDIYNRRFGLRYVDSTKHVKRSTLTAPKEELCIFLA